MLLPVFVQGQLECCGATFSLGDVVSWGLAFTEAYGEAVVDAEQLVEADCRRRMASADAVAARGAALSS